MWSKDRVLPRIVVLTPQATLLLLGLVLHTVAVTGFASPMISIASRSSFRTIFSSRRTAGMVWMSVAASPDSSKRNSDPAGACLVVGGGRGIGLAMARDLCTRFAGKIFVTARKPDASPGLQELIQAQQLGKVRGPSTEVGAIAYVFMWQCGCCFWLESGVIWWYGFHW